MTESTPHRLRLPVRGLMVAIAILAVTLAGTGWIGRKVQTSRTEAFQVNRRGQLKFIGTALHNYHDVFGSFPPAYTLDDQGMPLTSWRVLILPFLEEQALYDQYDQTKPWNSPVNLRLAAFTPYAYWDRGLSGAIPGETPHLAIVGHKTPINTHGHIDLLKNRPNWWTDIMLIHSARHAVPWTKPQDFDPADAVSLISEEQDHLRASAVLNAVTENRLLTEADRKQVLKYAKPLGDPPHPSSRTELRETE